jgi:hypothetical protein
MMPLKKGGLSKKKPMIHKTMLKYVSALALGVLFMNVSCSSDDNVVPDGPGTVVSGDGISTDDLDAYPGEIGIVINARAFAQKGRTPTEAIVNVKAPGGTITRTVSLDPFAFMGLLKFPVEELSTNQFNELTNGVPVEITISSLDDNNQETLTNHNLGTISFLANPSPALIETSINETFEYSTLMINEGTGVYLQKVKDDGTPESGAVRWLRESPRAEMTISANDFSGDTPDFVMQLTPVPERRNTFYIQLKSNGDYFRFTSIPAVVNGFQVAVHTAPIKTTRKSLNGLSFADRSSYFFHLFKVRDGVYRLLTHDGRRVKEAAGIGLTLDYPGAQDVYFRVVAKEVEWTVQPIAASIIEPVLPKATSGFGFNSTLTNCSSGELQQTVGADFSEVRTTTTGWSESISVNTTNSVSVSSTVGVSFDASFFGVGSTYNAAVTTGFQWSHSITSTSSQYASEEISQTETYFSSRVITVPPRKASLVYDAYQFYPDVRVNYVQRLRISGKNENGRTLSGQELSSLFKISRFNGVINTVEENSMVVTLRGFFVLDKFLETQSKVQEVPANCN